MNEELYDFFFDSEYEFSFEWISKYAYGQISPQENKVRINVRLMLLETMLHEYYHYKYPQLGEVIIERLAKLKVRSLTINEIYDLTDRFVAVWGGGNG